MTADVFDGPDGTARRVPWDRLSASLTGDQIATRDYWWVHIPEQAIIIAHAGAEPRDIDAVKTLEVRLPPVGDRMDTFSLGLITLDDLPGVPPAQRKWPWVTHELIVFTLDTSGGPVPFESPLPWGTMHPHNVSAQFQVDDDDQAREVIRDIAAAIVNGLLPPEVQAFVPERRKMMTLAPLYQLWQDVVLATAEHHRTGGSHEENMMR